MRRILALAALAAAGLAQAAGPARADYTALQTALFGPSQTPVPASGTGTLTVNKFDSSLGKLNFVEITYTAQVSGAYGVENTSTSSAATNVTVNASVTEYYAFNGNAAQQVQSVYSQNLGSLSKYDGTTDYGGTSGTNGPISTTATVFGPTNDSNASDLAAFTGPGTIGFNYSATGASNTTATGGNINSFYNVFAQGSVGVRYNYTPAVPTPASGLLMGVGLGGVALRRLRPRLGRRPA